MGYAVCATLKRKAPAPNPKPQTPNPNSSSGHSGVFPRLGILNQRSPDVAYATLELRERAAVVDHEIGARALELRRHLRGDHVHGFGLAQTAIVDKALQPQWARRVDQEDAIETVGHLLLEQQRDVTHHNAIATT